MKKMNKKGFTIVELVIVIAVIAILSAVLIPTFSGVVDQANATAVVADAKAKYQEYIADATLTPGVTQVDDLVYEDTAKKLFVVIENGVVGKAYDAEALAKAGYAKGDEVTIKKTGATEATKYSLFKLAAAE
jgi:prepilin-type N-terminal cleavage/methylation domain-containing protein